MAKRRIVISGMGAICALGHTANATWHAMAAGHSGIGKVSAVDPNLLRYGGVAAEVRDYDPAAHFDAGQLSLLDRCSQFAVLAAGEALAQSGLLLDGTNPARVAVVLGTGAGGESSRDEQYRRLYAEQATRLHPLGIVRMMVSAPASQVSMRFGITGPTFVVASACASANHAVAQAAMMIQSGLVDAALVGGTEACLTLGSLRAWEAMRVLAPDTCRPFSAGRRGIVLGEGAGMFVLETLEHAQARGAPILAELAGVGMSADAGDIAAPSAVGAAAAIRAALADAQLEPSQIDYINAHGTGTLANDSTETLAIHQVFGTHARRLAISSTKAAHGHALGASGALEMIALLGALRDGVVPPTLGYLGADPACDLDYVPLTARALRVDAAISNSFAFGGLNAVVALRKF